MTSVMKSPNMMSTTGRIPVIAAPSPIPEIPASEIGESITRSGPNSSTSPERTLNGVPASATSSPTMKTEASRRISSASASFTACDSVSSRVPGWAATALGEDMLVDLVLVRVRRGERELDARLDLLLRLGPDLRERLGHDALLPQPPSEQLDRIALGLPLRFLLFGAVVAAVDVADVVSVEAVGVQHQERGPVPATGARDGAHGGVEHRADVLAVDLLGRDSERLAPRYEVAGGRLGVVRVLVVEVVFAGVDHGQLPERCHVHHLVEDALPERALAEEADRDLVGAAHLRGHRSARRDSGRPADDRVRAEVSVLVVCNVHRAALAAAVARLLAEQLGEHAVGRGALRKAMTVTAMRAGDVVVLAECLADADGDGFLADVEVREARHLRAAVELVDALFEGTNRRHPAVRVEPSLDRGIGREFRLPHSAHVAAPSVTPDIWARTSKRTAKSLSSRPIPRAAVRNSFVIAVVGNGTSSSRPSSRARFMSFCIILTLNHASSGIFKINGPRYCTIGDAITLCVSTSTAVSRAIPLFSASSTPSQKASICTARLRFVPIFITSARPLSPTCVTFGPISSKSGFTFSKVSFRPPTITESFPSCSVITLPETGESTMSPPFSLTLAATSRL